MSWAEVIFSASAEIVTYDETSGLVSLEMLFSANAEREKG
jgi:hypothetical protein